MNETDKKKTKELTVYWTQAQPAVSAYISSLVTNFQDAEDLLQKVALTIAEKFDTYNPEVSFVAWAIGIAKNKIYQYYRDHEKDKKIKRLDPEAIEQITKTYELENHKLNEIKNALKNCMNRLTGRWKEVLEMRYMREFSITRIATHLGLTKNAVFMTLHRVRLALEECIKKRLRQSEHS